MSLLVRIKYSLRRSKLTNLILQSCVLILIVYCIFEIRHINNDTEPIIESGETPKPTLRYMEDVIASPQEKVSDPITPVQDQQPLEPLKHLQQLHNTEDDQAVEIHQKTDDKQNRIRSLFPTNFYSQLLVPEIQMHKNFFQFDPRFLPSLYISMINREISGNGKIPEGFALPFNWNMLTDNIRKLMNNPLYEELIKKGVDCEKLREIIPFGGKRFGCEVFQEKDETNIYGLDVKISENALTYFQNPDMRKLYAILHGLSDFKIPNKIIFLKALNNQRSLVVPTEEFVDGKQDLKNGVINHLTLGANILTEEFIEDATKSKNLKEVLLDGISGYEELIALNQVSSKISENFLLEGQTRQKNSEPLIIDHSFFEWNLPDEILKCEDKDLKTYLSQAADKDFAELKHFGEAYLSEKKGESGHFDWRFFNGFTQTNTELHQATIHRMLRSWFNFCEDSGVYSWINHGSLIGYYWNGYTLPFDNDIDVQVPIQSLYKLAKIANNSLIFDMSNDDYINEEFQIDSQAEIGFRSYYLDINPLFGARTKHISRNNLIDARFIDVNTGLYIDVTLLASFNSHTNGDTVLQQEIMEKFDNFDKARFVEPLMYNEFYDGIKANLDLETNSRREFRIKVRDKADKLVETIKQQFAKDVEIGKTPDLFNNLVHCRNMHFYKLDEFLPLIPTYFENIPMYIPSNWFKNLIIEYDFNAIQLEKFKTYRFLPNMQMWISTNQCKVRGADIDQIKETCLLGNSYVRNEYHRLTPYIEKHKNLLKQTLPFQDLKSDVTLIEDTFAIKHYHLSNFESMFKEFDNSLLRPEPWVSENLF